VTLIGDLRGLGRGNLVAAVVVDNDGADLIAEVIAGSVR
jgi:hypothetical protein